MSVKCQQCARPLYNRRRKQCEFCGAPILESQRLSPRARQSIDRMKADEARQHREFMSRNTGPLDSPIIIGPFF